MKDLPYIWRSVISSHRLIATTIILQIALALVVIGNAVPVIAGTLRSAWSPSGLAEDGLGVVRVETGAGDSVDFNPRDALAAIARGGKVRQVAAVSSLPLEDRASTFNPYRSVDGNAVPRRVSAYVGSEDAAQTLGLRLIEGRQFLPSEFLAFDGTFPSAPSVMVTRSLASYMWPGKEALGQRLIMAPSHVYTVVGVLSDIAETFPSSLHAPQLSAFFPANAGPHLTDTFVFRASGSQSAAFAAVRDALRQLTPTSAVTGPRSYEEVRGEYLSKPVRVSALFAIVCAIVVITMGIGVGTLVSYWIGRRSESIAIRRALGATTRAIAGYFITEIGVLCAVGIVIGSALTYVGNHYLGRVVEVRRPDPVIVIGAAVFFVLVNLVAVVRPVYRATQRAPAESFRLR